VVEVRGWIANYHKVTNHLEKISEINRERLVPAARSTAFALENRPDESARPRRRRYSSPMIPLPRPPSRPIVRSFCVAPMFSCRSLSWVICDPAPLSELVVVVEIQTIIAIGPVIPATARTID
jgi:hypothetical protein